MRAPHRHAVVREDGEARLRVADDPLRIVEAEMRKPGATLHENQVDHHHIRLVLLRDAVVVGGVGHPSEAVAKPEFVCLHPGDVSGGGREGELAYRVFGLRLEGHDLLRELTDVLEDDRVAIERIAWAEQTSPVAEPAVGHRLDHHVDVIAVIEMTVADHDGVELGQVDLALGVLHDRAGTRIEADVGVALLDVEAAGGGQLLGDHESRTGSAHERQFHGYLPPRLPGQSVSPILIAALRAGPAKPGWGGSLQQPRSKKALSSPRSTAHKALRLAPACRSLRPACRRGCERCAESGARSRSGGGWSAGSNRTPPRARPPA